MSTEAVKWAMDDAPVLRTDKDKPDTTARHVLQALAEHAHKDGSNARPSVLRIQYRTGYDRRTVQRALRRLEDGKLIAAEGVVNGCTSYTLDLKLRRPASDWKALESEEEELRQATAERVRKHREKKRVTHSDDVTVTQSNDVTDGDVTHSDDVRNGVEVRYVTHSASVRNARNAARTIREPSIEPSGTKDSPASAATEDAEDEQQDAAALPVDGGLFPDPVEAVCQHLADTLVKTGSKRPTINAEWRRYARLLLKDGVTAAQAKAAIDWAHADDFWQAHILTPMKLREKYDTLRRQAIAERAGTRGQRRGGSVREPVLTPEDWKTKKVEIDL